MVTQDQAPLCLLITSLSEQAEGSIFERDTEPSEIFVFVTALFCILTVVTAFEDRSSAAMVPSVISEEVIVLAVANDPKPRFVLAPAVVLAPVPPFAMATVPPLILVAVVALPIKSAVIVPAEKSPLPSLETIEFGVFELVAVVALLSTFPAAEIVSSFESEIDPASLSFVTEPFARSAVSIEPS